MSYQVILELPKNSFIRIGRGSGNVRWIRKSIFKSTIIPKDTPHNRMVAISILQGWFEREFAKKYQRSTMSIDIPASQFIITVREVKKKEEK